MSSLAVCPVGPRYPVAALYVLRDSIYHDLAAEAFGEVRDARTFSSRLPVVAHPPCRAWSRLRTFAKASPAEAELGPLAVQQVRRCGGVLEHPSGSSLWEYMGLPRVGGVDAFGGFFLPVEQQWWGHPSVKRTWLYVVGIDPADVPAFPFMTAAPLAARRPVASLHGDARSRTPALFAHWLLDLASRCAPFGKVRP